MVDTPHRLCYRLTVGGNDDNDRYEVQTLEPEPIARCAKRRFSRRFLMLIISSTYDRLSRQAWDRRKKRCVKNGVECLSRERLREAGHAGRLFRCETEFAFPIS